MLRRLEQAGREVDADHRRSLFEFLCALPTKRPIFRNQAREVLKALSELPDWRQGEVLDDESLRFGLEGPAPLPPPLQPLIEALPPAGAAVGDGDIAEDAEGDMEPDHGMPDVLSGMPPFEAFEANSRFDPGDTFKDFRKWARRLAIWDLTDAARRLDRNVRRNIFRLIVSIYGRQLYHRQALEMLSMLLPLEEWTDGDVVDERAVCDLLDAQGKIPTQPAPPPPPPPPDGLAPFVSIPAMPMPVPSSMVAPRESSRDTQAEPQAEPPPSHGNLGISQPSSIRSRVEAALLPGIPVEGEGLVALYQQSGLGGEATLSATACDKAVLGHILAVAGQRCKDFFVDPLQQSPNGARVHFPHLHIDLQRKSYRPMDAGVSASVERKIRAGDRWTCMEKASVLSARHDQTICYILAYTLSRAMASGRPGCAWISLGMSTGSQAQGHANAVFLQPGGSGKAVRVLVYDPNFEPGQAHWVHARKAVSDALPGARRLLEGTGIALGQVEMFGHGLQTALGTTSTNRNWLAKTVVTTHRGYPICGAVVHFLASVWLAVSQGRLEDAVEVESTLAAIVAEPEGKRLVQRRIAAMLQDLTHRHSDHSAEPFAKYASRRLENDRREWPDAVVRAGGSVTVGIAKRPAFTFSW